MSRVRLWFWWSQMTLCRFPPHSQVGHRLAFPSQSPSSRSKWPWECQASAGSQRCTSRAQRPSMPPNALAHKSLHEGAIAHCSSLISLLWPHVHPLEHTLLVCTCYSFSLEHFPFTLPSSPHPTSTSTWLTPTHFSGLGLDVMSSKP